MGKKQWGWVAVLCATLAKDVGFRRARHGEGKACEWTVEFEDGKRGVELGEALPLVVELNSAAAGLAAGTRTEPLLGLGGCENCRRVVTAFWAVVGQGLHPQKAGQRSWECKFAPKGLVMPTAVFVDQQLEVKVATATQRKKLVPKDRATRHLLGLAPGLDALFLTCKQNDAAVRGGAALASLAVRLCVSPTPMNTDVDIFVPEALQVRMMRDAAQDWGPLAAAMGGEVYVTDGAGGVVNIAVQRPEADWLAARERGWDLSCTLQVIGRHYPDTDTEDEEEDDDDSDEEDVDSDDEELSDGEIMERARKRSLQKRWEQARRSDLRREARMESALRFVEQRELTHLGGRGAAFDLALCNVAFVMGGRDRPDPTRRTARMKPRWQASPGAIGGIIADELYLWREDTTDARIAKYEGRGFPRSLTPTVWSLKTHTPTPDADAMLARSFFYIADASATTTQLDSAHPAEPCAVISG